MEKDKGERHAEGHAHHDTHGMRECDDISIETDGSAIVITYTGSDEADVTVTVQVKGECRTIKECHWVGGSPICD